MIELLNIAGTGPILGPIQGILFGPIAFLTIPVGCVIGGAFHDYMSGMISLRNDGEQTPGLVRRYLGRRVYPVYNVFVCLSLLLVGAVNKGLATAEMLHDSSTSVVGIVAKSMLGRVGGVIAVIGVIVLPITSGDTALRSLRIMAADALGVDTGKRRNNLLVALPIFAVVAGILFFAKTNASGFNVMWRYFAWSNECIAVFHLFHDKRIYDEERPPLSHGPRSGHVLYVHRAELYPERADRLPSPWAASYAVAGVLTLAYGGILLKMGRKRKTSARPAGTDAE